MTVNNPLNLDNFSPIDGKYAIYPAYDAGCFDGTIKYFFTPAFSFSEEEFVNIVSWLSAIVEAYKWELIVGKRGDSVEGYKFNSLHILYNGVDGVELAEKLNKIWLKRFNLVLCPYMPNSTM